MERIDLLENQLRVTSELLKKISNTQIPSNQSEIESQSLKDREIFEFLGETNEK